MESSGAEGKKVTRRELLHLLALSAIGAGLVVGAPRLAGAALPARKADPRSPSGPATGVATTVGSTSTATAYPGGVPSSSPETRVKVMYFQMSGLLDTKEEYFALQSPAYYRDLLADVLEKHPVLSPKMQSMLVLVDGVVARPGTALNDGDEVDFIPTVAGG